MSEVRLTSVTKHYGNLKIIDDLNLVIGAGEFVTLLGPSGSGKTTTLKIVAGLEALTSGKLSIGGVDMTRMPVSKRNIGMVFQNLALFPHMTVEENVAFGLRMRRVPKAEIASLVRKALDLVQLSRFAERTPDRLSGGQQQRVALARAFVINPMVLLLDEPLSALDRKLREEMQIEIRKLVRELELTAIFVTHDQEEALTLSDRVAVMNNGIVEQFAPPAVLFRQPSTEFVARFMGVSNMLSGVVSSDDPSSILVISGNRSIRFSSSNKVVGHRKVMIGLRPEDATIVPDSLTRTPPQGGNVRCRIQSVVFQGSTLIVDATPVDAPDLVLCARIPTVHLERDLIDLQRDNIIQLYWRPESVLIYDLSE